MAGLLILPAIFLGAIAGGPILYCTVASRTPNRKNQLIIEGTVIAAGFTTAVVNDGPFSAQMLQGAAVAAFLIIAGGVAFLGTLLGMARGRISST